MLEKGDAISKEDISIIKAIVRDGKESAKALCRREESDEASLYSPSLESDTE